MSDKSQSFKQAIKKYYSHKSLSAEQLKQLESLQAKSQSAAGDTKKTCRWYVPATLLASVAMVFFIISVIGTPRLINHAYADIQKDAGYYSQLTDQQQQWLIANNINQVPQQYRLEMSKYCELGDDKTLHLRIAGIEQGKLHLFFQQDRAKSSWPSRRGQLDDLHWEVRKLNADMNLIVMYTDNMRKTAVDSILQQMLLGSS